MKKSRFWICLLLPGYLVAQSPGGIPAPIAWLHGELRNEGNAPPSTEKGSLNRNACPDTCLLNYNPALEFNQPAHQLHFPLPLSELPRATIFVVYQHANTSAEQNIWSLHADRTGASIEMSTQKLSAGALTIPFLTVNSNATLINTYIKNQDQENNMARNLQDLVLGGSAGGKMFFTGKIAEFLLYERVLKLSEQWKIETWLALKYGASLAHDYVNASGKIIWHFNKNRSHNYRITGIGRDERGDFYQKQSLSNDISLPVALSAGELKRSNTENTSVINNGDFLVFGDNNGEFFRDGLMQREWSMNVTGATANELTTDLNADFSGVLPVRLPADNYLLVIDRNGNGNSEAANLEYYPASAISTEGIATFKHIFWDTDGSGKDVFSFRIRASKKELITSLTPFAGEVEITLFPNPSPRGQYNLNILAGKPGAIEISVFDEGGHLIQAFSGNNKKQYRFTGRITGTAGLYTFLIQTAGSQVTRRLVVQ